jgi:hypothetical protein
MARIKLTPELEQQILSGIRVGGYPHVAAEAYGVPRALFEKWMRHGEKHRTQPYRRFWRKVCQAQAQARLKAEMDARAKDARFWLHYGPGKETADTPGWSATVKPAPHRSRAGTHLDPELFAQLAVILEVLLPYPEARQALRDALGLTGEPTAKQT